MVGPEQYQPPHPSLADLELELTALSDQIARADENENLLERTRQLDDLGEQQDTLSLLIVELYLQNE